MKMPRKLYFVPVLAVAIAVSLFVFAQRIVLPALAFSGSGLGTEGSPFQITTCSQLQEMNNHLDAEYILMSNIDCSGFSWNPVGLHPGVAFTGVLDGNSKTVLGLSVVNNASDGVFQGLFGALSSADVYDLTISNATITAPNFQSVGILAGGIWNGATLTEITNVHVSGSVTGESMVGGLVGIANQTGSLISGCSADVDVVQEGQGFAGGLIGMSAADIDNCYSTGDVIGNNDMIGGLIGQATFAGDATVAITNSYATGNVVGEEYTGGLAGYTALPVSNCYAIGNISGTNVSGGLLGSATNDVTHSYSFGTVEITGTMAGGLIGMHSDGTSTNVYALGNVSGSSKIGGLIGDLGGSLVNGYSRGSVNATSDAGGLVGSVAGGDVTTSYYNSQTSGQSDTGKGTPITSLQMATQSTYTDWDFDDIWVLGLPVDLSSNPAQGGTIEISGSLVNIPTFRDQVKQATVSASPSTWYVFQNWTNDGSVVSTNSSYQFFYTGGESPEKVVTANFLYSYIAPIINDEDDDDDPIYNPPVVDEEKEEEEEIIPEEELIIPDEETPEYMDDDIIDIPEEGEESKTNGFVRTVQVLAASVSRVTKRVADTVKSLPITEGTSESISATALAVVAVAPAITIGMGSSFSISSLLQFSTLGFAFLGMGKKKRNCGMVYDSTTKEPIKNAIVRIYGTGGTLVATEVTNELGIFETNIETGDYSIVVNVSNYKFPSRIILGMQDLPYENIYRGGTFHYDSSSTINYSIPVDPLDKNILEDAKVISRNMIIRVFTTIGDMATLVGLVFAIISYMKNGSVLNLVLLIAYILIMIVGVVIRNQGKYRYGRVTDSEGNLLCGVELGLIEEEFNTVYAKRITDKDGRYRFIVPGGKYRLVSLDQRYRFNEEDNLSFNDENKDIVSIARNLTL